MARYVIWFLILLIVVPHLPQVPGCIAAHMPKSGRVVDVETGKGLPDAFVIASARFLSEPFLFGPSGYSILYNVIVRTDADGNFRIPSTWLDFKMGGPGSNARTIWIVTVFEPGYAVVGDENAWEEFDSRGNPRFVPRSTAVSPDLSGGGRPGNIGTIRMFKPTLTLKQASTYYSTVKGAGHPSSGSTDPNVLALRKKGYDLLAPWVCAENASTELDYLTAVTILGFAMNRDEALNKFEALYPKNYREAQEGRRKYKADVICKIMTKGTGAP